MDFIIRIAEKNIKIHSIYSGVYNRSRAYLVDDKHKPDIEVFVNEEMIEREKKRSQQSDSKGPGMQTIEGFLVHRLIANALLDYSILLMHGAVISVDNTSFMFTGSSGTGKTTHIQKWLDNVKDSLVVNGDKPFIMIKQEGVFACGNPWCGKEGLGSNVIVPLRSIIFMERNNINHIEEASYRSIFPALLEQTYQPEEIEKMRKTLELMNKLKEHVSFYRFAFDNFKEDAFKVSYNALINM